MVRSPIDRATVPMRRAISPRLAMSSERNMAASGGARCHARPEGGKHQGGMVTRRMTWSRRPMNVLTVYLRIYADALRQAVAGIGNHAWTVLLPIGLLYANNLASGLVMSIPYLGTFLVWIVWAAAASCYLYFVGEVVAKSKVKLDEFGRSIGAYFWSVANLFFVFWIAGLVVSLAAGGQRQIFDQLLVLAAAILLNAAPEVIYQRGSYGGLETAQRCIRFLQENWIEW